MKKIITKWLELQNEVIRSIISSDDRISDHNIIMYASFFYQDGMCSKSAHDELVQYIVESNKMKVICQIW